MKKVSFVAVDGTSDKNFGLASAQNKDRQDILSHSHSHPIPGQVQLGQGSRLRWFGLVSVWSPR